MRYKVGSPITDDADNTYLIAFGETTVFSTTGSDLRWHAELHSLSTALTPSIEALRLYLDNDADGVPDTKPGNNGGGDGGNCFIATAAFGGYIDD